MPYLLLVLILIFRPMGLLGNTRNMSETTPTSRRLPLSGAADKLRFYGLWVAAAIVLLVLPKIFSSGGSLTTFSLIGISIIFSLSYNILLGQTGMLSFGHAVYYGLGGFLAIHAMNMIAGNKLPMPLPLVPLIGGLAGLLFAVLLGWVSTRRSGTAFAMISLGVAELVASSRADPAQLLRRRSRRLRQPHQAAAAVRLEFRPADPDLLSGRGLDA